MEVIRIVYDPKIISYRQLLQIFWENQDVTLENSGGRKTGDQYSYVMNYVMIVKFSKPQQSKNV